MNDGISTRLRCQNSEEIEEVLEDSAMMFFFFLHARPRFHAKNGDVASNMADCD